MPRFDFECECGRVFEEVQSPVYPGRERTARCRCGEIVPRKWTNPPAHTVTFRAGFDMCTGEYHDTKKHYEETKRVKGLFKVE